MMKTTLRNKLQVLLVLTSLGIGLVLTARRDECWVKGTCTPRTCSTCYKPEPYRCGFQDLSWCTRTVSYDCCTEASCAPDTEVPGCEAAADARDAAQRLIDEAAAALKTATDSANASVATVTSYRDAAMTAYTNGNENINTIKATAATNWPSIVAQKNDLISNFGSKNTTITQNITSIENTINPLLNNQTDVIKTAINNIFNTALGAGWKNDLTAKAQELTSFINSLVKAIDGATKNCTIEQEGVGVTFQVPNLDFISCDTQECGGYTIPKIFPCDVNVFTHFRFCSKCLASELGL